MPITLADIETEVAAIRAEVTAAIADKRITFGEALAILNKVGHAGVVIASNFSGLSGAEKKALVDELAISVYRDLIAPAWDVPWLPDGPVDSVIINAIPFVTQSLYDLWSKK